MGNRVAFADGHGLISFEAYAKVVWKHVHFEQDSHEYQYGAEFTHISEWDKEKLNQLLTLYYLEEKPKSYGGSSNRDDHTCPIGPQGVWDFPFIMEKGLR